MIHNTKIDQIAALVAQASQYTEPFESQPPSPSMLERFLDSTTNALDKVLEVIEKPNVRERFAALIASWGVLGGGGIIAFGIAGIVGAVVTVKGAIALIVVGVLLVGIMFLLAHVVKGNHNQ